MSTKPQSARAAGPDNAPGPVAPDRPSPGPGAYEPPQAFDVGTRNTVNGQIIEVLWDSLGNRYIL